MFQCCLAVDTFILLKLGLMVDLLCVSTLITYVRHQCLCCLCDFSRNREKKGEQKPMDNQLSLVPNLAGTHAPLTNDIHV